MTEAEEDEEEDEEFKLEREMNDVLRLNVAIKTLQIMGQILRNFPGGLRREHKVELGQESYQLGLRTMKMVLTLFEDHSDFVREHLREYIQEKSGHLDDSVELERKVDAVYFLLVAGLSYGMIRRISLAVGSEHLKETYKEVLTGSDTLPTRMIDTSIKLNHFRPFPEKEVLELLKLVNKNKLALFVLRQLVRDHFQLHDEDYKLRQGVSDKLGIEFRDQRMIESKHKQ